MPIEHIVRFRRDLAALAGDDRHLGIAVSGGPDSLALLLLAHAARPGRIAAATVDHGLRAGAAAEARDVAAVCARLGVPHRILGGTPDERGSVQDRARRLRYRLLGRWAEEEALGWIATAHHRDDQAETFLMRAARGAGVAGLAGVRGRVHLAGVPIIRPLLGWNRAELAAIVAGHGLTPADDPSNRDPAHDRTAFRALLAAAPLLRPAGLAAAAAHLADAEEAIAWTTARLLAERLSASGDGVALRGPADLPRELRRRLAAAAIARVVPGPAPRGDALDRLLLLLDAGRCGTLGGVWAQGGSDWRFTPAPPRRERTRNRDASPHASIAINP